MLELDLVCDHAAARRVGSGLVAVAVVPAAPATCALRVALAGHAKGTAAFRVRVLFSARPGSR